MVQSIKRLFKSNYLFTLGVIICLAWIAAAILAPALAPYDPIVQDLGQRLKAPPQSTGLARTTLEGTFSAVCSTEEGIPCWQAALP